MADCRCHSQFPIGIHVIKCSRIHAHTIDEVDFIVDDKRRRSPTGHARMRRPLHPRIVQGVELPKLTGRHGGVAFSVSAQGVAHSIMSKLGASDATLVWQRGHFHPTLTCRVIPVPFIEDFGVVMTEANVHLPIDSKLIRMVALRVRECWFFRPCVGLHVIFPPVIQVSRS